MKNPILNKAIDEALEAALAALARSSADTNPSATADGPRGRRKTMSTRTKKSDNESERGRTNRAGSLSAGSARERVRANISGIIDHKVTLLALAGAAVNADAEPCLDRIVHELEGTGVTKDDIREAVKSGRFLGVRPDLAASLFEEECDGMDEESVSTPARASVAMLSTGARN